MSENSFSKYDDKTLLTTRKNLLKGLDEVNKALAAGSFHKVGKKGEAPPSQSGQLTLILLVEIQEELASRGHSLTW